MTNDASPVELEKLALSCAKGHLQVALIQEFLLHGKVLVKKYPATGFGYGPNDTILRVGSAMVPYKSSWYNLHMRLIQAGFVLIYTKIPGGFGVDEFEIILDHHSRQQMMQPAVHKVVQPSPF